MNYRRDLKIILAEFEYWCKMNPFVSNNTASLLSFLEKNEYLVCRRTLGPPDSNRRWINSLTNHELAKHLINTSTIPDYDYDYDDNLVESGTIDTYTTTDGTVFYDYEEAVDYETRWLYKERPGEDEESGSEVWDFSCLE